MKVPPLTTARNIVLLMHTSVIQLIACSPQCHSSQLENQAKTSSNRPFFPSWANFRVPSAD